MSSSDLTRFSKKELKLVCVHSGLCQKDEMLSKKQMRQILRQNKKEVIEKINIQGGMYPSPFCNPFASASLQTTQTIPGNAVPSLLFTAYQTNYSKYLTMGSTGTDIKFMDEYSAKFYASYMVLNEMYKVKSQTNPLPTQSSQIKYITNSTNASAYIYPMNKGACFLKVQNQGRCGDSFDHIENDCIISRLIRNLIDTDNTFKSLHMHNFVPILTSYILPPQEFKTTNYLSLINTQTNCQKTMSIPLLLGSPLLSILKRKYDDNPADSNKPGIYYDPKNFQIVVIAPTAPTATAAPTAAVTTTETRFFLKDLLFDLFKSMQYLYSQIGLIHNDAHLGNLFFDKRAKKLVLIDYGRSSINLNDDKNKKTVESEVQKLNFKKIDGTYPSYPKDFLNAYTIYHEDTTNRDVPLYMNDVASISFNIYRYLFENYKYNHSSLYFQLSLPQDKSDLTYAINKNLDQSKHLLTTKCSLAPVLNQGLYWLANYINNYNIEKASTDADLSSICGGNIMAPLLENGVFNSFSFDVKYVANCTEKKLISPSGVVVVDRVDSDYMISCTKGEQGKKQGGTHPNTKIEPQSSEEIDQQELEEAMKSYEEQVGKIEPKYTTAHFHTPNQPIPNTTPNPPAPAQVRRPTRFNLSENKVACLQKQFNERMDKLNEIFSNTT